MRALLNGVPAVCEDAGIRTLLSFNPGGGAPTLGFIFDRAHPVAGCRQFLSYTEVRGQEYVSNPTGTANLTVLVDRVPDAAPPMPPVDLFVICAGATDRLPVSGALCSRVLTAVLARHRSPGVDAYGLSIGPIACATSQASPCPSPVGATALGTVAVRLTDGTTENLLAWDVGGNVTFTSPPSG